MYKLTSVSEEVMTVRAVTGYTGDTRHSALIKYWILNNYIK